MHVGDHVHDRHESSITRLLGDKVIDGLLLNTLHGLVGVLVVIGPITTARGGGDFDLPKLEPMVDELFEGVPVDIQVTADLGHCCGEGDGRNG